MEIIVGVDAKPLWVASGFVAIATSINVTYSNFIARAIIRNWSYHEYFIVGVVKDAQFIPPSRLIAYNGTWRYAQQ
ncbi:MAG: hypothetical protein FWE34_03820 [Defluviitaleaceae bacterium]|nr:hypothetical protein [Defluviitaleaceae bacterium]